MLNRCFREQDTSVLFGWIELIREGGSNLERTQAEALLIQRLTPIASWFANLRSNPRGYDAEQVINDAICKLFVSYISNPDFQFRSYGHLVRLLSQITTNERRLAYRRNNQAKRVPHDADGHRLQVESLDLVGCNFPSSSEDPACEYESNEQIENCVSWLSDTNHKHVFLMLMAEFTWDEMAMKMNVDRKTVRLWVDQMRRILAPHISHLTPHRSHLTPHISHLKPQTSSFKPEEDRQPSDQ